MKRNIFTMAMAVISIACVGQSKNIEPEYIGQVAIINADSTIMLLQKETTEMKTKTSKWGMLPVPGAGALDKSKVNLIVKGASSPTKLSKGSVTLIVKVTDNNVDPKQAFGIFKFEVKKKNRQYLLAEAGLISGMKATTSFNTVESNVKKYGSNCYLVTIENLEAGEYGITTGDFTNVATISVE